MRLQLILLAGLSRAVHAQPAPEPAATGGVHVYADDDHVTVVSPSASVHGDLTSRLSIAVDSTVDVISAASVDVVTAASPKRVHEQRVELGAAATARQGRATWWTLGLRGSHEHDYDAWRVTAGVRTERAQRNSTLQIDYTLGRDEAGSAIDPQFEQARTSNEIVVTASQLASRRAVVDLVVDLTRARGYHASPYRSVLLDMPGSPLALRVDEVTPRLRSSAALAARLRYAFGSRWAASTMARVCDDTWDVASLTLTAEVYRRAGDWLIGGTVRGYTQSAATFYASRYEGEPRYRTRDRTLGAMQSAYGAVTVDAPAASWHVLGSVGLLRIWFVDFLPQRDRTAALMFASLARSW